MSDSYKFFRVPRVDVDGRPFLIRLLSVRRRRKYFQDLGTLSDRVRKEQRCKECIAMQPECASEGVTLALGRTSESLYTSPWRGSNRGQHSRTTRVPCTWRGTRGRFSVPQPRISQSRKTILHGTLLRNSPILFYAKCLSSVQPSISGDNIVHCRNGGIKHRSGEALNTRTHFIARWIATHGARSSEVSWDTGGRYAQLFRKLFYVGAMRYSYLLLPL